MNSKGMPVKAEETDEYQLVFGAIWRHGKEDIQENSVAKVDKNK